MSHILLFSCLFLALGSSVWAAGKVVETSMSFEGVNYRVVKIHPSQIQLAWKNDVGEQLRRFDAVQDFYEKKGEECVFLMNAGIFEPGGVPSGLHIQSGKRLRPLNTENGHGNFYLKPNGFFCITSGDVQIAAIGVTEQYSSLVESDIRLGIQSGPILLTGGEIHSAFRKASKSKFTRNGVGIHKDGTVVFAITDDGNVVNLYGFARLFQHLDCNNALYLDGTISRMAVNPLTKVKTQKFGAILVVTQPLDL